MSALHLQQQIYKPPRSDLRGFFIGNEYFNCG
jgi:hypothetical protein